MFNYAWFDFDIQDELPGFEDVLLPNSPENRLAAGVGFTGKRIDGVVDYRWVDEFRWAVGPFQGDVEGYSTVDLNGSFSINENWKVGVNVANAFDEEHWESFGGDLLGRRALVYAGASW